MLTEEKITPKIQELVETELRKGASNSRIANLLDLPYKEAVEIIDTIKEKIRPQVGENIAFKFRGEHMEGTIEKLLTNSAIVNIDWDNSPKHLYDLMEEKTVVNFKDIDAFLKTFNMEDMNIEDTEE
ncbi:hypothetical protein SAMN02745249_00402 [Atopostipes suicloacalis DSM 15692]|uniref:DUF2187 domain-containing protein n=1 Tax=Atopostipes suicloacalis DSM 15692 TaxID=1121025 RepID=A0A1M4TDY1_9LACT|nr:hypothetical protein SAMN02745249_00402 [Atopostipes suicloacalis DSM 15692]